MRWITPCLTVVAGLALAPPAPAQIVFGRLSSATQTITSPLFGGAVPLAAVGPQTYTVNPATGFANVTSAFQGTDLPNPLAPGTFLNYDLYNTTTTGTITPAGVGPYTTSFDVLFELRVTSGPLTGLTFETTQFSQFAASNIAAIPFPIGTALLDPTPPDTVSIFVKTDPTNTFPVGTLVGTSSGRTVTITGVPEPSSLALVGVTAGLGVARWRRRSGA